MTTIHDWSIVSNRNDIADDKIDWREGQLPSSINDSAREMMSRIKQLISERGALNNPFYDNNAYIFKDESIEYNPGQIVRFVAPKSNNGLKTYVKFSNSDLIKLYKFKKDRLVGVEKGDLLEGNVYTFLTLSSNDPLDLKVILLNPTISEFPVGMIAIFHRERIPEGWYLCNGTFLPYEERFIPLYHVLYGKKSGEPVNGKFKVPSLQTLDLLPYAYVIKS